MIRCCDLIVITARVKLSTKLFPGQRSHIIMHTSVLFIVLVVLLTGCASTRTSNTPPVNSNFTVQVDTAYDSLPNYSRIYFQHGMRIPDGGLDKWVTYCRLHVYNPERKADYLTSVSPGSFAVTKASNLLQSSRSTLMDPGNNGSFGLAFSNYKTSFGTRWSREGPPSYYLYRVKMKLSSVDQPDVQTLICSRKWGTRGGDYPTLSDIRRALGEHIEILTPSASNLLPATINPA